VEGETHEQRPECPLSTWKAVGQYVHPQDSDHTKVLCNHLAKLRRLLKNKGKLTSRIITEGKGVPSCSAYSRRFGSLAWSYSNNWDDSHCRTGTAQRQDRRLARRPQVSGKPAKESR
jgi:hypothetical protein